MGWRAGLAARPQHDPPSPDPGAGVVAAGFLLVFAISSAVVVAADSAASRAIIVLVTLGLQLLM